MIMAHVHTHVHTHAGGRRVNICMHERRANVNIEARTHVHARRLLSRTRNARGTARAGVGFPAPANRRTPG